MKSYIKQQKFEYSVMKNYFLVRGFLALLFSAFLAITANMAGVRLVRLERAASPLPFSVFAFVAGVFLGDFFCWSFFAPGLRVVWIITTLDSYFIYLAVTLGALLQMIFELNVVIMEFGEDYTDTTADWRFVRQSFLLGAVFVLSIVGVQLAELAHDAMQYPPFQKTRASLMVALMGRKGILNGDFDKLSVRVVDFLHTWALMICIVLGTIWFWNVRNARENEWLAALNGGCPRGLAAASMGFFWRL